MVALVDDADYERISCQKWHVRKDRNTYYAIRQVRCNGRKHTVLMHREILNTPVGLLTDHADRNGLNNQRSNIRICNIAENNRNVKIRKDSTSGYKGVSFHKRDEKWRAYIGFDNKIMWLGYFKTAKIAALAYDNAACELFGEFASLNFDMGEIAFG